MDIASALEVVTLIEIRISKLKENYNETELFVIANSENMAELRTIKACHLAELKPLQELKDYLQSFVEAQLYAEENKSTEP